MLKTFRYSFIRSVSRLSLAVAASMAGIAVGVTGAGPAAAASVEIFSAAVSTDPGDWFPDRAAPAGFDNIGEFEGRANVLRLSIDPSMRSENEFENHQGVRQDISAALPQAGDAFLRGDLWVPGSDQWQAGTDEDYVNTGIWVSTIGENGEISGYPILHFTSEGGQARLKAWDPVDGQWVDLRQAGDLIEPDGWNTFDLRMKPAEGMLEYVLNGQTVWSRALPEGSGEDYAKLKDVFLQGYNNGQTGFEAYWSSLYAGLLAGSGDTIGDFAGSVMISGAEGEPVQVSVAQGSHIEGAFIADGSQAPVTASFEGPVTIDGDVAGDNAGFAFSKAAGASADVGGDVDLAQGSSVSGNAAGSPGAIGGDVTVDETSTMGGNWRIGGDLSSSGRTAPGNSIGTIEIAGDAAFSSTHVLETEIDGSGNSDRVLVSGTASLDGRVELSTIGGADDFLVDTPYSILTSTGGLDGEFAGVDWNKTGNHFLDAFLSQDDNDVDVTIARNAIAFASAAQTPNQAAAAAALDGLPLTNGAAEAVARLSASAAPDAFDQLSGEIHAGVATALIDNSQPVRDAVSVRIRTAFGAGRSDGNAATGAWGQVFGSRATRDGNGNAARMTDKVSGFLTGLDGSLGDTARLGIFTGYANSSFDLPARRSEASADSYYFGAYAGMEFDKFLLSGGAAYGWNDISTSRSVGFGRFSDSLSADYKARAYQIFGEGAYRMEYDKYAVSPFAGIAYVNLDTDGFRERGGDAALSAAGGSRGATFSTLGIRAESDFDLGGATVKANGMIGWRRAWNGNAGAMLSFDGSSPYSVSGTPFARDVAVMEAGLDARLTGSVSLGLAYAGQAGSGVSAHGVKANIGFSF